MDKKQNKYISASYTLYDADSKELIEQTSEDRPFDFISGFGITLEAFEVAIVDLNPGDKFDFTLAPAEAYGEYYSEHVFDLDKAIFNIDGKFDDQHIVKDAIVPLQNADGERFNARVMEVGETNVKVDLNHPLAGKKLNFKGEILSSREATNEEISKFVNMMNGGGCGSCGGECGDGCGNCGEGGCSDGSCGCH